jgi:hypothetical protein
MRTALLIGIIMSSTLGCTSQKQETAQEILEDYEVEDREADEKVRHAIENFRTMGDQKTFADITDEKLRTIMEDAAANNRRRADELETLVLKWKSERAKEERSSLWKEKRTREVTIKSDAAEKRFAVTMRETESLSEQIAAQRRINRLDGK